MDRVNDLNMWYADTIVMHKGMPYYVSRVEGEDGDTLSVVAVLRRIFRNRLSEREIKVDPACLDFFCPEPMYINFPSGAKWLCRRKRKTFKRGFVSAHWTAVPEGYLYAWLNGAYQPQTSNALENSYGSIVALSNNVAIKAVARPMFATLGGDWKIVEQLSPQERNFILSEISDANKTLLQ